MDNEGQSGARVVVGEGAAGRMADQRDHATGPPPMSSSDMELLRAIRHREQGALTALYGRYGGLVYTLALRIVGDRGTAEEVVQDAFLR